MARVMRTLVFTIHNPSRRTTATLHRALRAYTNAAAAVLEGAAREWDALCADAERDGTLNLLQLQRTLTRRYRSRTTAFPLHSSLRDAVFVDLAAQLSGYHALLKRWEVERDRVRAHIIEQGWSLEPLDSRAEAALRALGASPSWPNVPRTRPDYAAFDNALERLTAVIPAIPATSDAAGAMSPQRTTKAQRLIERLSEQASPSRDQVPRRRTIATMHCSISSRTKMRVHAHWRLQRPTASMDNWWLCTRLLLSWNDRLNHPWPYVCRWSAGRGI